MNHPLSEKAWTIWKGQVPTHRNCQTMLTDESVMLKYNISIIESHWLIIVCISSGSYSQLMLGEHTLVWGYYSLGVHVSSLLYLGVQCA